MFLRASAIIAALSLLISYFIYTLARVTGDLIRYETYDKLRYVFKAAYYIGDILTYIPLAIFLIAFFNSRRGDAAAPPPVEHTIPY